MRVMFDGYWWGDGPPSNRAVQRELILAWSERFPDDQVVVALRRHVSGADLPSGVGIVRTRLWPHGLSNALELRPRGADVVIAHNFAAPRRCAVFVHDAMFIEHPEWFSRAELSYFAAMLPMARRAMLVATSTSTEAARIERALPALAPVAPIGLAPTAAIVGVTPRKPLVAEGIDEFALTVGRLTVRKNLAAAIAAANASTRVTAATPLIVVGSGAHSGRTDDVAATVAALPDPAIVRLAGRLDDAELAWLYRHASLVMSLSRDEGFGLTPLEAVAFGAPVLVSDLAVHRETVGDAAHRVDPDADPPHLGAAVDLAWDASGDPHAAQAALERYTWAHAVERLRDAVVRSQISPS